MKYPIALACLWALVGTASAVPIINEAMSSNTETLTDADGDPVDWVEIYNPDSEPYSLEDHYLTDDINNLTRWAFPEVEIPANGYLVVYASGKNRRDPESPLHTNFAISRNGEHLALVGDDGDKVISNVLIPPLGDDQSYILIESDGSPSYEISSDPTPGAINANNIVIFSHPGQAFTDTLTIELSSPSGESISYTEDGRKPTLFNKKTYNGPIQLDKTAIITASAGNGASRMEVFIKVDPELAQRDSDIPMVIVDATGRLQQNSFTDMAIGVLDRGDDGRAALVGEFSTHSRGAIRTRGETSNSFPKKPLRFEFWDENDDDRDLPLLGMPADSDWVLNARYTFDRTLIHNAWIYELSNQIGQYAPRTRFVELYLNDGDDPVSESDYQGIYTVVEKISRGADRVDVETMAVDATEEPEISGGYIFRHDKTDPNTWDFNGGGVSMQMIYPPEEQRSERQHQRDWIVNHLDHLRDAIRSGSDPETGYPSVIEEQAWIDHQLLNLLTLNVDALRLSAYFYKSREGKVIAGPVWDFDRSAGGPVDSRISEAETWRGAGGDQGTHFFSNRGSGAAGGTPVWWHDLFSNPDFHTAWADRWFELRENEFSDANIAAIIDGMGAELAESAERNFDKWPGAPARSANQLEYSDKSGHAGEIEHMKNWIITRAEWITDQLITRPSFTPTEVVNDGPVEIKMRAGGTLFKPDEIYFTTNGEDPRAQGGDPSATATKFSGSLTISETTRILARNKDDAYRKDPNGPPQTWSGLSEVRYFVGEEPASSENIVVSEIMYNPLNPSDAEETAGFDDKDDFEFIELLNIGDKQVSLAGARLRGAADFDFAEGTSLAPGERLVLVSNLEAFAMRYGTPILPAGEFSGGLTNSGARVFLRAHDRSTIHEFNYSDDEPWPQDADGEGKSLVLQDENGNPDPSLPGSWKAGATDGGTPGAGEGDGGGPVDPEPGEGFDGWLAEKFSAEQLADDAISGPDADADEDGLPTLAEYYLGGDPLAAESDKTPRVAWAGDALQLTFNRVIGVDDVDASLQVSTDLIEWTDVAATEEVSGPDNGDGTETVVWREASPDNGSEALYARILVTQK